tara:strand:+ start:910 stop:1365 length:456 start_codon:yes stop_codon:yes gene_type:complete
MGKKSNVPLPKPKPRVTKGDVAKKVGKIVYQSSVQYPYQITKGILTGDRKSLAKGFGTLDALKKQKESGNLPKVGQIKTNKVQKNLKMVKPTKKAEGGSVKKNLKPVPKGNKGLGKLPTEVRNKMGFMNKGGLVKGGTSAQMTGKEYKGTF